MEKDVSARVTQKLVEMFLNPFVPHELVLLRNTLTRHIRMTNACKAGIWLSLSTLARAGELAKLRADEIDWEKRTWFLHAHQTKSKREHLIHLSEFAYYWLCQLRDNLLRRDDHLFPGTRGGTHAKNTSFRTRYRSGKRATRRLRMPAH